MMTHGNEDACKGKGCTSNSGLSAIWGEWSKCLPYAWTAKEKKKREKKGISIHMELAARKPHK